jgi:hypothetical protein
VTENKCDTITHLGGTVAQMAIPKYDELFNPVLKALHDLGGSATNQELEDKGDRGTPAFGGRGV